MTNKYLCGQTNVFIYLMQSARCIFTKFIDSDFESYYRLASNPEVVKQLVERPRNLEHGKEKFEAMLDINRSFPQIGYYKVDLITSGDFMGLGKIVMTENGECEIGYSLQPEFWGQGYGFELAQQLMAHIKTIDAIRSIKAMVDFDNLASRRILIKNGFTFSQKEVYKGVDVEVYLLVV